MLAVLRTSIDMANGPTEFEKLGKAGAALATAMGWRCRGTFWVRRYGGHHGQHGQHHRSGPGWLRRREAVSRVGLYYVVACSIHEHVVRPYCVRDCMY